MLGTSISYNIKNYLFTSTFLCSTPLSDVKRSRYNPPREQINLLALAH
jgi:hypothetical protein